MGDIKVGFTGTQKGIIPYQLTKLREVLEILFQNGTGEFHHGDCIGADAEAHALVRSNWPNIKIVCHPCTIDSKRARCKGDIIRTPLEPLVRNRKIVAETDILVATPKFQEEELRSGTWATVRHARKMNRRVILVKP